MVLTGVAWRGRCLRNRTIKENITVYTNGVEKNHSLCLPCSDKPSAYPESQEGNDCLRTRLYRGGVISDYCHLGNWGGNLES